MNETIGKCTAMVAIPAVTVLLLRAIYRNPEIVGLKQQGAIASQTQAMPPRQELENRLISCSPRSKRTVSLLTDKELNDQVFACEKK